MKKLLWILAALFLPFDLAWGQELSESQHWIEQVDGGIVVPASTQAAKGYALGIGGDVLMGYRFTRAFSLSADLGYYDSDQNALGGSSGEWDYTPLMMVARFNMGAGWIRPYVLLGAGVAFNNYTMTAASVKSANNEADFLLSPGLGAYVVVASDMILYVQTRLDIDFTQARTGLPPSDSPTLFIPIKAGIAFLAL